MELISRQHRQRSSAVLCCIRGGPHIIAVLFSGEWRRQTLIRNKWRREWWKQTLVVFNRRIRARHAYADCFKQRENYDEKLFWIGKLMHILEAGAKFLGRRRSEIQTTSKRYCRPICHSKASPFLLLLFVGCRSFGRLLRYLFSVYATVQCHRKFVTD